MKFKKMCCILLCVIILAVNLPVYFASASSDASFELIYGEPVNGKNNIILVAKNCLDFTSGDFNLEFDNTKIDFEQSEAMPDVKHFCDHEISFDYAANTEFAANIVKFGMSFFPALNPEYSYSNIDINLDNVQMLRFYFDFLDDATFPVEIKLTGEARFLNMAPMIINETFFMSNDGEYSNNEYEYKIESGNVTITKYLADDTKITIPSEIEGYPVVAIGNNCFYQCESIEEVIIQEGITEIGSFAFSGCTSLENIYLADTLETIGFSAFYNCDSLTEIEFPDSLKIIDTDAFGDCDGIKNIYIPPSVEVIHEAFIFCNKLAAITVDPGNIKYLSENGVLFSKDKTVLEIYPAGKKEASYVIPETVKTVTYKAFYGCDNLKDLTVNSEINVDGFYFSDCDSLENIFVSAENNKFTSVDGVLFSADKSSLLVYPKGRTADEYIVPAGVKKIDSAAFYCCSYLKTVKILEDVETIRNYSFAKCTNLKDIIIPVSLKYIDMAAFLDCNALENIYYTGSESDWSSISFSTINYDENKCFLDAKKHYNYYEIEEMIIPEKAFMKKDLEGNYLVVADNTVKNFVSGINGKFVVNKDGKSVAENDELASGMEISVFDYDGNLVETKLIIVIGDNDGNGKVQASDARTALRASVGLESLNAWQEKSSNVADIKAEKITAADARMILRCSVGLEDMKQVLAEI